MFVFFLRGGGLSLTKMKMETTMQRKWALVNVLLLLFLGVLLPSWAATTRIGCEEEGGRYNTSGGPVAGKMNVHLVAHTHDDVGWLKTVDQYYIGSNNAIQVAAVEYILDSVIDGLLKDKNRKFIYVEQAFFQRWWRQQSKETHVVVKNLVKSGQLEFINGGWCMHDEATTHYIDLIDQTTLGHRFIKEQFNKIPRIGWQIDPFGHSAVQAYLLGAEVGFDAVFFARADYQDIAQRREEKKMEVIWRGSKTLGETSQIFAGVLANHYSPPKGFNFDVKSEDPPMQDDPRLFDYNVKARVDLFVQRAQQQSGQFRTNHIMWTMGEDFAYEYAETWFKQLDKLIHYVNKDGRVNAFYSTPSMYVDAKNAANEKWPIKEEDFFPYADSPNGYWTGYFTSRPSLKGYVRKLSGILQAARQLESFIGRKGGGPNTDSLEEAMAVLQHHDGVSGTEQQHVANDYATRLAAASIEAAEVMNSALASIISSKGRQIPAAEGGVQMNESDSEILSEDHILLYSDESRTSATSESIITLEQCPLLNVSICPPSENFPRDNSILVVVAYNSLGWERKEFVRIPVSSDKLEIFDSSGNSVTSQIVPLSSAARQLRSQYANADETSDDKPIYLLTFSCNVPPLGYSSYFIKASAMNSAYIAKQSLVQDIRFDNEIIVQSSSTQFHFSNSTGLLNQIKTSDGTVVSLKQSYCWYKASDGYTSPAFGQASGAYVFRPSGSNCFPVANEDKSVISAVVRGPVVEEVHQQFSSWLSQVVRVYENDEHAEIEFFVGPIPINDGLGKEIVTKLASSISSNKVFYTDSNGRDFIRRIRDYRHDWNLKVYEPIAGNYYPINAGIYLSDNATDFSILVDRAIGGSSIVDGELELMLHRRLLHDDGKGVAEALNEIVCLSGSEKCEGLVVKGTFYVSISGSEKSPQWRRNWIQRVLSPLQLAFSIIPDDFSLKTPEFSLISSAYQLPPNVAIITLQELRDSSILLRLAHLYEINESKDLSTVARVKLSLLFAGRKIKEVVELSLSANQKKSEMKHLKWQVADEDEDEKNHIPFRGRPLAEGEDIVELGPMEIRTFNIFFS